MWASCTLFCSVFNRFCRHSPVCPITFWCVFLQISIFSVNCAYEYIKWNENTDKINRTNRTFIKYSTTKKSCCLSLFLTIQQPFRLYCKQLNIAELCVGIVFGWWCLRLVYLFIWCWFFLLLLFHHQPLPLPNQREHERCAGMHSKWFASILSFRFVPLLFVHFVILLVLTKVYCCVFTFISCILRERYCLFCLDNKLEFFFKT